MTPPFTTFEAFTTCDALFWDFDGVIVESLDIKTQAFLDLFNKESPEILQKIKTLHYAQGGMSRYDKFDIIYADYLKKPLPPDEKARLSILFSELVFTKVVASDPVPGVLEFLTNIHQKAPCFVISGTPETELKAIIKARGWTSYFKSIKGSPENKIQHLDTLIQTHGFNASNCVFFGDATTDLTAAKHANMPFVLRQHEHNHDVNPFLTKDSTIIDNFKKFSPKEVL